MASESAAPAEGELEEEDLVVGGKGPFFRRSSRLGNHALTTKLG